MTRVRERSYHEPDGYAWAINPSLTNQVFGGAAVRQYMSDVVGNRGGSNPLFAWRERNSSFKTSGIIPTYWRRENIPGGSSWEINDFYSSPWNGPTQSRPSDNSLFGQGLVQRSPNQPISDVPNFVKELGDIPAMLKDWGDEIIRKGATSGGRNLTQISRFSAKRYLEWQFAISPFLSDLQKMLDFQREVNRRVEQIRRLHNPGGDHASATVFENEKIAGDHTVYVTGLYMEFVRVRYVSVISHKSWVSTRWKPLTPLPQTDDELYSLAYRLAYGLNFSMSTVWNAMPWSWLIDWFSNVGDIIDLGRNHLPVVARDSCLMHQKRGFSKTIEIFSSGLPVEIEHYPDCCVVKERRPMGDSGPTLEYNLPFLSGSQTGILGSLAVLRRRN